MVSARFGHSPLNLSLSSVSATGENEIEVLDIARAGKIHAHVERFPLDRVEDTYARMWEGTLDGRAVICPQD